MANPLLFTFAKITTRIMREEMRGSLKADADYIEVNLI